MEFFKIIMNLLTVIYFLMFCVLINFVANAPSLGWAIDFLLFRNPLMGIPWVFGWAIICFINGVFLNNDGMGTLLWNKTKLKTDYDD
jgi:hypothetical protein